LHLNDVYGPEIVSALARDCGLSGRSIVIEPLDGGSGPSVRLDPGAALSPASMIKVPIAAALTERWAEGSLAPDQRVAIEPANMTPNDAPSPLVPGYSAGLEELARLMLVRSDNVATNVLIDVLGRESITARCRAWGLAATAVCRKLSGALPLIDDPAASGRNSHPAGDAALLFRAIAEGRFASTGGNAPRSPNWLFETLAAQEWNEKLPAGLLAGDRFAHKTGDTDEVSHDGGILDLPGGARYVVVVYTALPSLPENDVRFGQFMRGLRPLLA
jgi:beta-lactamase class A